MAAALINACQLVGPYGDAMGRSFIAITAIASTLMFAGVWKATEPQPSVELAIVDTGAASVTAATTTAPPTLHRGVIAQPPSMPEAEPYDVVRPAYGSSAPVRRLGNAGSESSAFYRGCREARAAGATPLHRGEPGYRVEMDGDGDGIACEDYRR